MTPTGMKRLPGNQDFDGLWAIPVQEPLRGRASRARSSPPLCAVMLHCDWKPATVQVSTPWGRATPQATAFGGVEGQLLTMYGTP